MGGGEVFSQLIGRLSDRLSSLLRDDDLLRDLVEALVASRPDLRLDAEPGCGGSSWLVGSWAALQTAHAEISQLLSDRSETLDDLQAFVTNDGGGVVNPGITKKEDIKRGIIPDKNEVLRENKRCLMVHRPSPIQSLAFEAVAVLASRGLDAPPPDQLPSVTSSHDENKDESRDRCFDINNKNNIKDKIYPKIKESDNKTNNIRYECFSGGTTSEQLLRPQGSSLRSPEPAPQQKVEKTCVERPDSCNEESLRFPDANENLSGYDKSFLNAILTQHYVKHLLANSGKDQDKVAESKKETNDLLSVPSPGAIFHAASLHGTNEASGAKAGGRV